MEVMGKCCDSTAARQIVPDEGDTLKRFHLSASRLPLLAAAFSGEGEVGTCVPCGRLTLIESGCVRRCRRCGIGSPPVYATRPVMPMTPGCMSTRSDCAKRASP